MHRILQHNLRLCHGRSLWKYIELGLDVHLGLADKVGLLMHLSKTDHTNFNDLWRDVGDYVFARNFNSIECQRLKESDLNNQTYWGRITLKYSVGK